MKNWRWQVLLSIGLVLLTVGLYGLHFYLFHDARHIFIYLLGDIAFLPVAGPVRHPDHQPAAQRTRQARQAEEAEHGHRHLSSARRAASCCGASWALKRTTTALKAAVIHDRHWGDRDFKKLQLRLSGYEYAIDPGRSSLAELKVFLVSRRAFLLALLGNPNLLEHDKFTDLLWAVFHLTDELVYREDFAELPATDLQHLAQDLRRAFHLLVLEWLAYMQHLKQSYPYLFSLAIRTNPFDPDASPIVR